VLLCFLSTLQCRLGRHNKKPATVNGLSYGTAARSPTLGRLTPLPASNNANSKSVKSPPSLPSFYSLYSLSSTISITLLPVCVQTDCPPLPTRLSFCSASLSCLSKTQANSLSQRLFPPRQCPPAVNKCRIGSDLRRTAGTSSLGKCEVARWSRLEGPTQGCAVKPFTTVIAPSLLGLFSNHLNVALAFPYLQFRPFVFITPQVTFVPQNTLAS